MPKPTIDFFGDPGFGRSLFIVSIMYDCNPSSTPNWRNTASLLIRGIITWSAPGLFIMPYFFAKRIKFTNPIKELLSIVIFVLADFFHHGVPFLAVFLQTSISLLESYRSINSIDEYFFAS